MKTLLFVIDGFGIGECEDSCLYNDQGSNTFQNLYLKRKMELPNFKKLGLFNIDGLKLEKSNELIGSFGRIRELSAGKDTTTGHWEIAGIVLKKPFPTFPNGFPKKLVEKLEEKTGFKFMFNNVGSGTALIQELGEKHLETGELILYTSADSVLQIAAHTSVISLEKLYEVCEIVRKEMVGKYAVGRVIARPFAGDAGNFYRLPDRKDFSLDPPKDSILDIFKNNNLDSIGIGKIEDIFAFRGLTESYHTHNNEESIKKAIEISKRGFNGFMFINLIDTDMLYGHRNDVEGYAKCIEAIDKNIPSIIETLDEKDLLIITADHGCDPTTESTDHSREFVPLLVYSKQFKCGVNLGTINGFNSLSNSLLDYYGIKKSESFLKNLK